MLFFEMLKKLKKKRKKTKRNKAISLAIMHYITAWLFLLYLTSKLSVNLKFGKPLMSQEYKRIL